MTRLIDADALKTKAIRCETFKLYDAPVFLKAVGTKEIDKAPTIDAMPVVRCKDCIYSYEEFGFIHCTFGPYGDCKVPSQFYCAEGKRKRGPRGVE